MQSCFTKSVTNVSAPKVLKMSEKPCWIIHSKSIKHYKSSPIILKTKLLQYYCNNVIAIY